MNKFDPKFPNYDDDSDYNTNANSYYKDLGRKTKLIKLLAKRIWEYDKTLNETLEQIEKRLTDYISQNDVLMTERLENWDKRIDEMPEEMKSIFIEWLNDGTLEKIINDYVLGNKADKTYVDIALEKKADQSKLDKTNAHLTQKITKNQGDVSSSDLSQEVKELLTGGSVAVLGNNMILEENIVNEQVTPVKTNFLEVVSNNLFDNRNIQNEKAINPETGELFNNDYHSVTDYVPVFQNTQYSLKDEFTIRRVAFYDGDYNYLEDFEPSDSTPSITTPPDTQYIRLQLMYIIDGEPRQKIGSIVQVNLGSLKTYDSYRIGLKNKKQMGSDGLFSVRDYGATGDASIQTYSIQSALDTAYQKGGGTVIIPPGIYLIDETLVIHSNVNLVGVGQPLLRLTSDADLASYDLGLTWNGSDNGIFRPMIATPYNENSENVTVTGLTVDGNGENRPDYLNYYEVDFGILLYRCKNGKIDGNHVKDIGYTFKGYGVGVAETTESTISNNYVVNSGYENIAVRTNSHNIIVTGNHTKDGSVHNIQVSSMGGIGGCSHVTVTNNTLTNGKFISHGFDFTPMDNIVFANNTLKNDGGIGVHILYNGSDMVIDGNVITSHEGIRLEPQNSSSQKRINVTNNTIVATGVAIDVREVDGKGTAEQIIIKGNNIDYTRDFNGSAIHLRVAGGLKYGVVEGNVIKAHTNSLSMRPIFIERNANNVSVLNNLIETNFYGIDLGGETKGGIVSGNQIIGVTDNATGIRLYDEADDVMIYGNNLLGVTNSSNRIVNTTSGENVQVEFNLI